MRFSFSLPSYRLAFMPQRLGPDAQVVLLSVLTMQRSKEFQRVEWTSSWGFLTPNLRLAIFVSAVLDPRFLCPVPLL